MGHPNLKAIVASLFIPMVGAHAADVPLDAVSGASGGRKMVTISKVSVTATTAAITFSEGYRNGDLRFYYSTTAFASTSDTTRSTVTKSTVASRGSGTVNLSGLKSETKYYYRFQGYYPKGVANYWATGSFTTESNAGLQPGGGRQGSANPAFEPVDALGRRGPDRRMTHAVDGSFFRTTDH